MELSGEGKEFLPGIYFLMLKGEDSTAIIRMVKAGNRW
jgi:hypothetical protein